MEIATSYTDRARQATTYRKGRVLLAGDAAHVHSPFGGQGMNTGFGDAMNLGWKLAATIKGWAPKELLDTYTAERHPIGEWVLNWTRAQVAIIRTDPHARAMATVIRDLIATKDGTNYFVEKISGVSMRYDLGGEHPLTGRSAPDFELEDGTRLGDLLQRWPRPVAQLQRRTKTCRHCARGDWTGCNTSPDTQRTRRAWLRSWFVPMDSSRGSWILAPRSQEPKNPFGGGSEQPTAS